MEMTISSRNVEVSESLRAAAHEKVTRLTRHSDGWEEAEVHFFEERNPRIADKEVCEVTLRGHGHVLRAKAASPDAFTSVDRVVDKLGHQMEKLKSRMSHKAHHHDPKWRRQAVASGNSTPEDDGDQRGSGRIVKVKQFDLKPMTPEEAALQMELVGHTFYFFTNAESGVPALLYRRDDGDLGLIDPT